MDLSGKVAIVTGASGGIGSCVTIALAERGVKVTLTGRRMDRLEPVAERVRSLGAEAFVVPADLRFEQEIAAVFERSHERWGRLDIVVNNAAAGISSRLRDGKTADWREMWEVNVLAVAIATREALRRFDPESGGHILNVCSTSGHRVPPRGGFYPVTKFALRALSEALRLELVATGSRSRVSTVSPGRVDTAFFERSDASDTDPQHQPEAVLRPEDVAAQIIHILQAPPEVEINDVIVRSVRQLL